MESVTLTSSVVAGSGYVAKTKRLQDLNYRKKFYSHSFSKFYKNPCTISGEINSDKFGSSNDNATDLLFSCPSPDISDSDSTGSDYAVACRQCSSFHLGMHTAALCALYA